MILRKQYGEFVERCDHALGCIEYPAGNDQLNWRRSYLCPQWRRWEQASNRGHGFLGIDWELEDKLTVSNVSCVRRPWDNEVRSPFDEPGVNVKEGEYILAVNGIPLDTKIDPYAHWKDWQVSTSLLKVNSKPSMDGARKMYR